MARKWYMCSVDETAAQLHTDAQRGLNRREVRSRRARFGKNDFFVLPQTGASYYAREVLMQPAVIMLAILGILYLVFYESKNTGWFLLLFDLFYAASLILLLFFAGYIKKRAAIASRPIVHVVREGRMLMQDCIGLVPGDVVELEAGDIVPCDVRLVSTRGIAVSTYLGLQDGEDIYVSSFKDPAMISSTDTTYDISKHTCMLYAGSRIDAGRARGLVVETGKHTYIGALQDGLTLRDIKAVESIKPGQPSDKLRAALWILLLPLTVICTLFSRGQASLSIVFTTLVCLFSTNLLENQEIVWQIASGIGLFFAAHSADARGNALAKPTMPLSEATDFDYLFLLGKHAFSDGRWHLTDVFLPQIDLKSRQASGKKSAIVAKAMCLMQGIVSTPAVRSTDRLDKLHSALKEYSKAGYSEKNNVVSAEKFRYIPDAPTKYSYTGECTYRGEKILFSLTLGAEMITRYTYMMGDLNKIRMDDDMLQELSAYVERMHAEGNYIATLSHAENNIWILDGVFSFSEHFYPGRSEDMDALRALGITPLLFLREDNEAVRAFALRSGILTGTSVDSAQAMAGAASLSHGRGFTGAFFNNHSVFLGFSVAEIERMIEDLQKAGHRVAILANRTSEYDAFQKAFLKISCANELFHIQKGYNPIESDPGRGTPDGSCAAQQMICDADILVPRASQRGGGTHSVVHAVNTIRQTVANLTDLGSYLLFSCVFRVIVILPLLFAGQMFFDPIRMLFCTAVPDACATLFLLLRQYISPRKWMWSPLSGHHSMDSVKDRLRFMPHALLSGGVLLAVCFYIDHNSPDPRASAMGLYLGIVTTQFAVQLLCFGLLQTISGRFNLLLSGISLAVCVVISTVIGHSVGEGGHWYAALTSPYGYLVPVGPLSVIFATFVKKIYAVIYAHSRR